MRSWYDTNVCVLADFFSAARYAWMNKQYNIQLNGEAALLSRLACFNPQVVFDVGANIGVWSLAAGQSLPTAMIHAFEIAPPTAAELRRRTWNLQNKIKVNEFGLGERAGEVKIYLSPESSTATSTLRAAIDASAAEHRIRQIHEINAEIMTGDAYLSREGISRVDLLKIDVEGAEMSVLEGFAGASKNEPSTSFSSNTVTSMWQHGVFSRIFTAFSLLGASWSAKSFPKAWHSRSTTSAMRISSARIISPAIAIASILSRHSAVRRCGPRRPCHLLSLKQYQLDWNCGAILG